MCSPFRTLFLLLHAGALCSACATKETFLGGTSMNKTELIAAVAEKAGMTKKDAEIAVSATFAAITEGMIADGKVQVVGFGSFETKERNARIGRNPKTKESIEIPASVVPVFKAGKALKDKVAK